MVTHSLLAKKNSTTTTSTSTSTNFVPVKLFTFLSKFLTFFSSKNFSSCSPQFIQKTFWEKLFRTKIFFSKKIIHFFFWICFFFWIVFFLFFFFRNFFSIFFHDFFVSIFFLNFFFLSVSILLLVFVFFWQNKQKHFRPKWARPVSFNYVFFLFK